MEQPPSVASLRSQCPIWAVHDGRSTRTRSPEYALQAWARLVRAIGDSMTACMVVQGGAAWLRISESEATSPEALHQLLEYAAGQHTQYLALATAGACRPTAVHFPHASAGAVAEYEKTLGVPVTFRHETFELHLLAADLALPIVTANADIHRIMREAAEQQMRAAQSGTFRSRVELALRRRIRDSADHSREGIAQQLANDYGQFFAAASARRALQLSASAR